MSHFPLIDEMMEWPEDKVARYELGVPQLADLLPHFRQLKSLLSNLVTLDSCDLLQPHLDGLERARSELQGVLHRLETADANAVEQSRHEIKRDFHKAAAELSKVVHEILFWQNQIPLRGELPAE